MDVLTPEQRKRCMSSIRNKNTLPEMIVRKMVHGMGYRFRLHRKDLPGKPDIVFPRLKKIIQVHGCYWHMHNCRYGKVVPKTNTEFWQKKRRSNVERDKINDRKLEQLGWTVLVLWECETRDANRLLDKLSNFLS